LREGEKTLGVWLPLALADIMRMLAVVSRRAAGFTGEVDPPSRALILSSWQLPAMSAAVAEDEEEAKAFAMLKSVQDLAKR